MRIDVSKFLFIGSLKDSQSFLLKAQDFGYVEFIHPKGERLAPIPKEAEPYALAIKILRGYALATQEIKRDLSLAEEICHEVLRLKQTKDGLEEEARRLKEEIERISPFGSFPFSLLEDIAEKTGRKVRFYCAKSIKALGNVHPTLVLVNSLDGIDYFISIEREAVTLPDLLEEHIPEELPSVQHKLQKVKKAIHEADERLKALTCYSWLLHYAFYKKMDFSSLDFVKGGLDAALDDKLFVVQGWAPNNKRKELEVLCNESHIIMEQVKIEPHETPPTFLENKRLARVGEDLVHIFDTPSPTDKDPSLWLLTCFSLFFAMIIGDAGYGLLFLITALILHFKIRSKKAFVERFLKLVTVLSISCILWGALTNSFFGVSFSRDNPLRQYSLINWLVEKKAEYHFERKDAVYEEWVKAYPKLKEAKTGNEFLYGCASSPTDLGPMTGKFSDNIAMEFALFIGSVHLITGLLRYLTKNPIGIGWVAFIVGAYLYIPKYLGATSMIHFAFGVDYEQGAQFGLQLLIGGIAYATVAAIVKNGIFGIFEVMTSIQIFSDILSYLRIYALGLAGAIMSATINDMASGLHLFAAIILMVFAHAVNIVLSIMGGTIHGLRLNFLEWYHYSFEGGGKRFKPLAIHPFE